MINERKERKITMLPKVFPIPFAGITKQKQVDDGVDIAIMTTNRCNSACTHCFNESGPIQSEEINPQKLAKLFEQGMIFDRPISRVGFSGGEIVLYSKLLDLVNQSAKKGYSPACITGGNGVTKEWLQKLATAGCIRLTVSTDKYHSRFVSYNHAVELANLAAKIFPEVVVLISSITVVEAQEVIDNLESLFEKVEIYIMSVERVGRAVHIDSVPSIMESSSLKKGEEEVLVVNFNEEVYKTCQITGFTAKNRVCNLDELLLPH